MNPLKKKAGYAPALYEHKKQPRPS